MPAARAGAPPGLLRNSVYDELHRRFVTGKFMPGSSLSTRGVATELGVGQMPVREAPKARSKSAPSGASSCRP